MAIEVNGRASKRLFILGATGGIGRALVDQAIARGHSVTAFVRSPEKLGAPRPGLRVVEGDPRNTGELRPALVDHDAVISALGPPGPGATTIHRDCAQSTIAAMRDVGARRLAIVSAAVLFEDQGFTFWLFRKTFLRNVAEDTTAMERIVMASGLDWTIARPPRLTNGPLTARYAFGDDCMPAGQKRVSRADVAHFLLDDVERGGHIGHRVGMTSLRPRPSETPLGELAR